MCNTLYGTVIETGTAAYGIRLLIVSCFVLAPPADTTKKRHRKKVSLFSLTNSKSPLPISLYVLKDPSSIGFIRRLRSVQQKKNQVYCLISFLDFSGCWISFPFPTAPIVFSAELVQSIPLKSFHQNFLLCHLRFFRSTTNELWRKKLNSSSFPSFLPSPDIIPRRRSDSFRFVSTFRALPRVALRFGITSPFFLPLSVFVSLLAVTQRFVLRVFIFCCR